MTNQTVQAERTTVLYHRSEDSGIFSMVGRFPLISASELSQLLTRNLCSLRDRLMHMRDAKMLGSNDAPPRHIDYFEEITCAKCGTVNRLEPRRRGRTKAPAILHYVTPDGAQEAKRYGISVATAWASKSDGMVPHDRGITESHLALYRGFGPRLRDWYQAKSDAMKETVVVDGKTIRFYPDFRFRLDEMRMFLEFTRANPSSENGEDDIYKKTVNYNALQKAHNAEHGVDAGMVLFVFQEVSLLQRFIDNVADDFPFQWIRATDLESLKHDPTGRIWVTPYDLSRRYGLIEQAA